MKRMEKRIRQLVARIGYYGIGYVPDYLLVAIGKRSHLHTVAQKESRYPSLQGQELIDELGKWFYASTGEKMDFQDPITFNQKMQWFKVYDKNPLKSRLADKYLVRDWVAEKIGTEYLVPLLGVWDRFDDIDFSNLPDKFALKCNHGCGWNIIVTDKSKLDLAEAKEKIDRWMATDFAYQAGFELHYGEITPKIIAEEYMENDGGDIYDYKIHCFNGQAKYVMFLSERKTGLRMGYFDLNWNLEPFFYTYKKLETIPPKPDNLDQMIWLAEKLSEGFPFVRVDFYRLNDGSIRFGEMTFTPATGTMAWYPPEANKMLGDLICLPKEKLLKE